MGYASAVGMIEHAGADVALRWHLESNHYPPLPDCVLPVAKRAIKAASAGEWDAELKLPAGMTWRGKRSAPVSACVEAWHLDAFVNAPDKEDK